MKTSSHLWYLAEFFWKWEMFQTKVVEKIKRHTLWPATFFFRKSCRLWDNVEKYWGAREDIENMAPACGILDKWESTRPRSGTQTHPHTYTHADRNMQYRLLPTTTMVSWTRLSIRLHSHFLSCCKVLPINILRGQKEVIRNKATGIEYSKCVYVFLT